MRMIPTVLMLKSRRGHVDGEGQDGPDREQKAADP
jgi:hypothetical protein